MQEMWQRVGLSRSRDWQERKIVLGLCKTCGKRAIFKNNQCQICREANLSALRNWKIKNKEKGIYWKHGVKYVNGMVETKRIAKLRKCLFCEKPITNRYFCNTTCSAHYHRAVDYKPNKIDAYLRVVAVVTGGALPSGVLTAIAKEVGMSRERVRQRANKLDLLTLREYKKIARQVCPICEKEFEVNHLGTAFCSPKCRNEHNFYKYQQLKICEECKLGFLTPTSRTRGHLRYCSKNCQGKWLARTHGWSVNRGQTKYAMSTEKLIEDLGEVFNSKGFMDKYGYKTPVTAYTALLRLRKLGKIRLLGGGKYRYYEVQ